MAYLSRLICTGRDHFHKRVIEYYSLGKNFHDMFQTLKRAGLYHMGSIANGDLMENYQIIADNLTISAISLQSPEGVGAIIISLFKSSIMWNGWI